MRRLYQTIRVLLKAVRSGKIQLVDATGLAGEFTNKELFQQYGFASRPLAGAEGVMLLIGGADNAVVIATEDRRYRIALESGEAAIYTDEGDKVHLKRNKEIHIKSGSKVTVEAESEVSVTAPAVNLGDASGGRAIVTEDFLTVFNAHTHAETGGTTSPPGSPAMFEKTTKVKAS
ncbi:MAG: phage baseplate assembly protein [Deltaproteobacteria bacterium]|nr:phage baseplate assembly protein [Deltaproteobacteria bacterium]